MTQLLDGRLAQRVIAAGVVGAVVGAILGAAAAGACEQASRGAAQATAVSQPAAPPAAAGMRIYNDPVTGEILDQPPPGAAPAPSPRSAPVLRQSAGTTPAGGVKLEGDFRMGMRTRADGAGHPVTDCVPNEAGKAE